MCLKRYTELRSHKDFNAPVWPVDKAKQAEMLSQNLESRFFRLSASRLRLMDYYIIALQFPTFVLGAFCINGKKSQLDPVVTNHNAMILVQFVVIEPFDDTMKVLCMKVVVRGLKIFNTLGEKRGRC